MSKVTLRLKNADSQHWESLVERELFAAPRTGDFIEIEGGDTTLLYRVVAVIHSQVTKKTSPEVYGVYIGETAEVMEKLFKDIPVAKSAHETNTPIGFIPAAR